MTDEDFEGPQPPATEEGQVRTEPYPDRPPWATDHLDGPPRPRPLRPLKRPAPAPTVLATLTLPASPEELLKGMVAKDPKNAVKCVLLLLVVAFELGFLVATIRALRQARERAAQDVAYRLDRLEDKR